VPGREGTGRKARWEDLPVEDGEGLLLGWVKGEVCGAHEGLKIRGSDGEELRCATLTSSQKSKSWLSEEAAAELEIAA
jgi:hypothetical protein